MSSSSTFFSRGMITQDTTKFYMIGKLKDSVTSSDIPNFLDSDDQYYVLCQNEYTVSDNRRQRLYWSSDLNDLVRDYSTTSLNQGPVEFTASYNDRNVQFSYLTQKGDILSNNKKFNNLTTTPSSIVPGVEVTSQNFLPSQNSYNLKPTSLFFSVPYTLSPSENKNTNQNLVFPWCFRKTNTSDVTYTPKVNIFTSTNTTFNNKNLSINAIKSVTGIRGNKVNSNSNSNTLNITFTGTQFDDFPNTNGVVYMEKTAPGTLSSSVFYYEHKRYNPDGTKVYFSGITLDRRDIYGSSTGGGFADIISYKQTPAAVFNMHCELRNDINNFEIVEYNSDSASPDEDISKWMDIYFIPSTENAYFSDIHLLTHYTSRNNEIQRVKLTPTANYQIYAPGYNIDINEQPLTTSITEALSFEKYYFSQFSSFFISYLLAGTTTYWKSSGYNAYPTIGKGATNRSKEPDTKETLFTWSGMEEAKVGYMYNYCTGNATCGSCYGNNADGSNNCNIHPETRKLAIDYTTPGTLGAFGTGGGKNQPLSHKTTRNELTNEFYAFIGINATFFLLLIIALIIYGSKKSTSDSITKMRSLDGIIPKGEIS